MRNKILLIIFISAFLFVSRFYAQSTGTFVDTRDNSIYRWVKIGTQTWMAENLHYANVPECGYYNLPIFGRFYSWYSSLKACPPGWHLPSDEEWKTLERTIGMSEAEIDSFNREPWSNYMNAGSKLKSVSGWKLGPNDDRGLDTYGFTALPGGYYHVSLNRCMLYGSAVYFWTSTSANIDDAITRDLDSSFNNIIRGTMDKSHKCYIRCVKDY